MAFENFSGGFAPHSFRSIRIVGETKGGPELTRIDDNQVNVPGLVIATFRTPFRFSFVATPGAANVCEVAITVQDANSDAIQAPVVFPLWLSDAASGAGLTATSASGTVQAKAASGTDLGVLTAKKALLVQTTAAGVYTLEITDVAKTGFFVAAQPTTLGRVRVSAQLQAANYG